MKSTLIFITLLFALLILPKCQRVTSANRTNTTIGFTEDSGYIYKSELLRKIKLDSTDSIYHRIIMNTNDTIGKYYKSNNGHYFSCLDASDSYIGCIIIETFSNGNIVAKEQFGIGINECCWDGGYDGFKKYGDYISLRSCTTGSAICGGSIRLFKRIKPQDEIGSICETLWHAMDSDDNFSSLTSSMKINKDTVVMYYNVEEYSETDNKRIVRSRNEFIIRYLDNNSVWTRLDSTKFSLGL